MIPKPTTATMRNGPVGIAILLGILVLLVIDVPEATAGGVSASIYAYEDFLLGPWGKAPGGFLNCPGELVSAGEGRFYVLNDLGWIDPGHYGNGRKVRFIGFDDEGKTTEAAEFIAAEYSAPWYVYAAEGVVYLIGVDQRHPRFTAIYKCGSTSVDTWQGKAGESGAEASELAKMVLMKDRRARGLEGVSIEVDGAMWGNKTKHVVVRITSDGSGRLGRCDRKVELPEMGEDLWGGWPVGIDKKRNVYVQLVLNNSEDRAMRPIRIVKIDLYGRVAGVVNLASLTEKCSGSNDHFCVTPTGEIWQIYSTRPGGVYIRKWYIPATQRN